MEKQVNELKLLLTGLILCAATLLNAATVSESTEANQNVLDTIIGVDGIVDIYPSSNSQIGSSTLGNKILYIASKNDRNYLAITDEAGSFTQVISPSYSMINSLAVCPRNGLIAYATRNKNFKSESFIQSGIKGESRPLGSNIIPQDFSNDCKTLIYSSADKQGYLYSYNIKTSTSKLLLKKPVLSARWSTDDNSIVLWVMAETNGAGELYMLSYPSLKLIRLTKTPKIEEINPAFLSEDLVIFGTSPFASGVWRLATYNLITGEIDPIKKKEGKGEIEGNYVAVLPKENKLLYVEHDSIHRMDINKMENSIIAHGNMPRWFVTASGNGYTDSDD